MTQVPPMLGDLVRAALASHHDLELLPYEAETDAIVRAARETRAEVVILAVPDLVDLQAFDDVLYEMRDACLVGVTMDGRHVGISRLTPQHEQLHDVDAVTLADAVRTGAAAARERAQARLVK